MELQLSEAESRVLGSLLEKEFSTPEYYPLSLNALVNACNQKSNREPVVSYGEQEVLDAIEGLRQKKLLFQSNAARVPKYEETFLAAHNFIGSEASILAELMLRGPQTPAELRARTERMHTFTPEDFTKTLGKLESYGYIMLLERQPGRKEPRYAHMLAGSAATTASQAESGQAAPAATSPLQEKIDRLERELAELKQAFIDFKRQFD